MAGNLGQLVKFSVGRQRPYAHAGAANPDGGQGPYDANLSFYSAHTNFTFAVAAAAGTVAAMRGYRWAPAVYVVGGLVGAATGYLRIAADQHYFTDVLTGAVVGSAVGVGVPYLSTARAPVRKRPATGACRSRWFRCSSPAAAGSAASPSGSQSTPGPRAAKPT